MKKVPAIFPPTRKEIQIGLVWWFFMVAALIIVPIFKAGGISGEIRWGRAILVGTIGGTIGFLSLLVIVYLPLKIVPRIRSSSERRGIECGDEYSIRRGKALVTWGFRGYLVFLIALNAYWINLKEGRGWFFQIFWVLVTLWLMSSAKKGIHSARDFLAYILLLGVPTGILLLIKPYDHPVYPYQMAFLIVGSLLGAMLLFSKDVNYYLLREYDSLPKDLRRKLEKKKI